MSRRKIIYQNWIVDIGFAPGRTAFILFEDNPSEPNREIIAAVREAIEELSPLEKEFVERFYFHGQSYLKIADELGKRPRRIEGIHRRAISKLKKSLAEFVREKFDVETTVDTDCIICNSTFRKEIDAMIDAKKDEETWKNIIGALKKRYGIKIKSPQVLIGHEKYHLT
ncbi:MAG: sigma-70 family RNA polymerase sigma factor [Candidatus Zixiibacteriota bacterium]|nr:MAG: sigma-70 family RNA polymerase sigma factor [candidate division Zixibacteria bacterium]